MAEVMPVCWKCGSNNIWWGKPVQMRNHDILRFGVCQDCWSVQDTVNGKQVRTIFVAIRKAGTS